MAQQNTPKNSGKSSIATMLAQRSAPPAMAAMPPQGLAPAPALAPRAPAPPTPPLPPGAMPQRMPLVGAPGAVRGAPGAALPPAAAPPGAIPPRVLPPGAGAVPPGAAQPGDMQAMLARLGLR